MSESNWSPAVSARPDERTITRIAVTAEIVDGTVITWSADRPENVELDISRDLDLRPIGSGTDLFSIPAPPPLRVAVKFEAHPARPAMTSMHAASRYECPLAGCPWPLADGSELAIRAHVLAHAMLEEELARRGMMGG